MLWRLQAAGVIALLHLFVLSEPGGVPPSHKHGSIRMGVPDDRCDNGEWKIEKDWDSSNSLQYQCQYYEKRIQVTETEPLISCLENYEIPDPEHRCMTDYITYKDEPPRGGPHRPLWPVYGEYTYVPPQRWVHSLEHGAAVFLYHPCADPDEVDKLKDLARSCLRRHIITPYRKLPRSQPLAVVTYGCKLTMSYVDQYTVVEFIKENALNPNRAGESGVWKDGQYSYGLKNAAKVVSDSDTRDSNLCPGL